MEMRSRQSLLHSLEPNGGALPKNMPKKLRKNLGTPERIIRILLGITLCILSAVKIIGPWGYIGVLLTISGLLSFCPIYKWLGISTCVNNCEIDFDYEHS